MYTAEDLEAARDEAYSDGYDDAEAEACTTEYNCNLCGEQCYPADSVVISGKMMHRACVLPAKVDKQQGRDITLKAKVSLPLETWLSVMEHVPQFGGYINHLLASHNIRVAKCKSCNKPRVYEEMVTDRVTMQLVRFITAWMGDKKRAATVHTFCCNECDERFAKKVVTTLAEVEKLGDLLAEEHDRARMHFKCEPVR